MRVITWHVPAVAPGANRREAYRLDGDYNLVRAWAHLPVAPTVEVIIDINVDGKSIFSYNLRLQNETDADSSDFASVQLSKDSLVTLDVDQGEGSDMTVGLELEEA